MTLKEIKVQSMLLMHMDAQIVYDADVAKLEWDANYGPLYAGMVPAINRCYADIEGRRILPQKRYQLTGGEGKGRWHRFSYAEAPNFFEIARLCVENGAYIDDDHPFVYEDDGVLRVDDFDEGAEYYLYYYPALPRVYETTKNSEMVPLPEQLARAVPWFVMSEIFRVDEPGEANDGRNHYEAMVEQYAQQLNVRRQGAVQTVFGC